MARTPPQKAQTAHGRRQTPPQGREYFEAMGDLIDQQLETRDGRMIGRVADIAAEWRDDGSLVLTDLLTGPQALTRRVGSHLTPIARLLLRDRFEQRIALSEVEKVGPTLRLRGTAESYPVGQSDRWIADHILRFIPGSGHR